MPRRSSALPILLAAAWLAACASSGASTSRDPNVIARSELAEVPNYTALEAVRRLRPAWLRVRGGGGPLSSNVAGMYEIRLHLDGSPQQDLAVLDRIQASDVREMRFLSGPDATTRFGTGYPNGVILVTTIH